MVTTTEATVMIQTALTKTIPGKAPAYRIERTVVRAVMGLILIITEMATVVGKRDKKLAKSFP